MLQTIQVLQTDSLLTGTDDQGPVLGAQKQRAVLQQAVDLTGEGYIAVE